MTAYLKWLGMSEAVLSLFRGLGAVAGVAATFSYPLLHNKTGAFTLSECLPGSSSRTAPLQRPGAQALRVHAVAFNLPAAP
jgi:Ferroportin1 (FPN1)